ncbi:MAG: ABC transporter ATP-binding protein [Saccharospirillum sp.]|nr:ABC transporter ATP-binding protein [Saccharospirillum sp.]
MDSRVQLQQLSMSFGDFTAVHPLDLDIRSGEFFSFLGPSGCGKTTLLNIISGFLTPTSGTVTIGGEPMASVPANKRPTSMIFQNLALFPLMTVAENIEFGLEVRGISKPERRKVSDRLLELVDLTGSGDKRIDDLSGGQKQRVAIARALAVEPRVLLLDEPLSALDLKLRQHMRSELKEIQRRTEITFIYITHDQGEALTMSDRVAVMSAGRLQQVDEPMTLYQNPATPFVAEFVGENNRIAGEVVGNDNGRVQIKHPSLGVLEGISTEAMAPGTACSLYVRPERLRLVGEDASPVNRLQARLDVVNFEGAFLMLESSIEGLSDPLKIQTEHSTMPASLTKDHPVSLVFDPADALVMPESAAEGGGHAQGLD